jgi:hypothetical protein
MIRKGLVLTLLVAAAVSVAGSALAQAGYYVLDGFGGVHAGGGAAAITPAPPYFGFDVARDLAYVPYGAAARTAHGDGVLVLDGFGGVHAAGKLPGFAANPRTPYFGFNVARAIAYRNVPPRLAGVSGDSLQTDSLSYVVVTSVTVHAPAAGYLFVLATARASCPFEATSGFSESQSSLAVDQTAIPDGDFTGVTLRVECTGFSAGEFIALSKVYPVEPGAHTAHLLGKKGGTSGGNEARWRIVSLTALFVAQGADGS